MTNEQVERMIEAQNNQIAKVWELFKKTDEQMTRTDEKINKLIDSWARFVECFLAPGIPRAFRERKIEILGTAERQKRTVAGVQMEIDILGVNSDCVVAVEVKTTLRPEYVQSFLEKLPKFKHFFPEYKDRIVYGAVAGIDVVQAADSFAENQGLWVIGQRGDTVIIKNEPEFQPRRW